MPMLATLGNGTSKAYASTGTALPPVPGYVAWYTGDSWTGTRWNDLSGNGNHVTSISGTVTPTQSLGTKNANKKFNILQGTTGTSPAWPANIPPATYTFIHLTRYNGTEGRIYTGTSGTNWLSGFWSGLSGQAYHSGWLTNNVTDYYADNWVLSTDQNSLYRGYSGGSSNESTGGGGSSAGPNMTINGGSFPGEVSDWQIAEILIYASTLSSTDYTKVENYLKDKYNL